MIAKTPAERTAADEKSRRKLIGAARSVVIFTDIRKYAAQILRHRSRRQRVVPVAVDRIKYTVKRCKIADRYLSPRSLKNAEITASRSA